NPISQLDRTEFLFKRMLSELQVNLKVQSYVLFVNYDFKLYGSLVNMPMIFPSQIKRFLKITNENARYLTENTKNLMKILAERRKKISTYERYPKYDLTQLKRGVFCQNCSLKLVRKGQLRFICKYCCK